MPNDPIMKALDLNLAEQIRHWVKRLKQTADEKERVLYRSRIERLTRERKDLKDTMR